MAHDATLELINEALNHAVRSRAEVCDELLARASAAAAAGTAADSAFDVFDI